MIASKKFKVATLHSEMLADTHTPVSMYLQLRDQMVNTVLLESSDYHGNENAVTYLCCEPVARFEANGANLEVSWPDGNKEQIVLDNKQGLLDYLKSFRESFDVPEQEGKLLQNGLFGYMTFEAVQYFDDLELEEKETVDQGIPDMLYQVYRYVIAFNHFNEEIHFFAHSFGEADQGKPDKLDRIKELLQNRNYSAYHFEHEEEETAHISSDAYKEMVEKGIWHCKRGDVFQIVLSRRFSRKFKGDEFNVYRALRAINPSPYLFYFDYGSFKIFGSSPEAQLVVKDGQATIYPIAGTFRRTSNDEEDASKARELFDDPKENSEHTMLVDLARNDLSRHSDQVEVENFKEIQFFSHVIHMVSKVVGRVEAEQMLSLMASTFPAGTLSGAPKYKAMQLINQYEQQNRGYYGGCIGFMGFDGTFNHAIMIRSFLSQNNTLHYQAGAGVVAKSIPQNEHDEVDNKLRALRKAIARATSI